MLRSIVHPLSYFIAARATSEGPKIAMNKTKINNVARIAAENHKKPKSFSLPFLSANGRRLSLFRGQNWLR